MRWNKRDSEFTIYSTPNDASHPLINETGGLGQAIDDLNIIQKVFIFEMSPAIFSSFSLSGHASVGGPASHAFHNNSRTWLVGNKLSSGL